MIIEISKVPSNPNYVGEESASLLELDGRLVKAEGPIQYDLTAEIVSRELIVRGTLKLRLAVECGRCLDFFSTNLEVSSFLRAYAVPEGTEIIDITGDIREEILLNLPFFPVCRPECKGLCPRCGKNLNEGPCSCKPSEGKEGNWSALDNLKLE